MTLENSPEQDLLPMELPSMSSAGGSRARTFRSLANELASKVRDLVFGRNTHASLASYDPASSSWKTSQACLVSGWEEFSETFPRSGLMLSGTVYQLAPSAPLTDAIEYGSLPTPTAKANMMAPSMQKWPAHRNLLPTPTSRDWKDGTAQACQNVPVNGLLGRAVHLWPTPHASCSTGAGSQGRDGGLNLQTAVQMWPTPTSLSPAKDGNNEAGNSCGLVAIRKRIQDENPEATGSLNPEFVEWLMGFPLEWTVLDRSETRLSRRSSKQSATQS
jgi:hypothetical protein